MKMMPCVCLVVHHNGAEPNIITNWCVFEFDDWTLR